jgi:hypothetical protein
LSYIKGICPYWYVMTVDIHRLRERLASISLPWPLLVAGGAVAVAIVVASGATTAAAADLGASPAQAVQSVGLLHAVSDPVRSVLPRQGPSPVHDTRGSVRPVLHQIVDPVIEPATATAVQTAAALPTAPTLPPIVLPFSNPQSAGLPPHRGLTRGLIRPAPGTACDRAATCTLSTSSRAANFWLALVPGHFPPIDPGTEPGHPGLPALSISAVGGGLGLGGTALGIAAGLWVLAHGARAQPGAPVPIEQTLLSSLVERPG